MIINKIGKLCNDNFKHHFICFNGHTHLPAGLCEIVLHLYGSGELPRVPCQVPLSVGVLYIQPQDIVRNIVFIKLPVNTGLKIDDKC